MADTTSSKNLRTALFVLVPVAWFSFRFWQPLSQSYSPVYSISLQWLCGTLMATVFLVSLLSWRRRQYRLLSAFGFLVCFLWLCFFMMPFI